MWGGGDGLGSSICLLRDSWSYVGECRGGNGVGVLEGGVRGGGGGCG